MSKLRMELNVSNDQHQHFKDKLFTDSSVKRLRCVCIIRYERRTLSMMSVGTRLKRVPSKKEV